MGPCDGVVQSSLWGRAEERLNLRDGRLVAIVGRALLQGFNFLLVERPEAWLGAYVGIVASVPRVDYWPKCYAVISTLVIRNSLSKIGSSPPHPPRPPSLRETSKLRFAE